mgnify:CR=1 FL=1
MTLPIINAPEYKLNIPSTDEVIRYRPFLVKEEKLLLIAQETGTDKATYEAIRNIIKSCCLDPVDINKLPLFDMEYIFLNIRAKSVGETVKIKVKCPDDEKTEVEIEVNLAEVNVEMDEDHDPQIQLTDNIGITMAYPHLGTMQNMNAEVGEVDGMFNMICDCMYQIWDGEDVHDCMDYNDKEKMEFLNSLSHEQFEKIQKFFETMPTVKHEVEVTNPKTKKKSKVTLQGMNSFF